MKINVITPSKTGPDFFRVTNPVLGILQGSTVVYVCSGDVGREANKTRLPDRVAYCSITSELFTEYVKKCY